MFVLAVIYNFINQSSKNLTEIENENESESNMKSNNNDNQFNISHNTANNDKYIKIRWNQIAKNMWQQYQDYLNKKIKIWDIKQALSHDFLI